MSFGICEYARTCEHYRVTSKTCNSGPQGYCGIYRRREKE